MFEAASELHTTILLMCDCQLLVKTLLYLQLAVDRTWLLLIGAAILSTCCIKLSREIKFAWKVAKDTGMISHYLTINNEFWKILDGWVDFMTKVLSCYTKTEVERSYVQKCSFIRLQCRKYNSEDMLKKYHEEICVEFGLVAYSISYLSE